MPTLYVVMGPQASGKSTWWNNNKKEIGFPTTKVGSDDCFAVDPVTGKRFWEDEEGSRHFYSDGLTTAVLGQAWAKTWQQFGQALGRGDHIVFEATFPTKISRSHLIHIAKAFGYQVVCIYLTSSLSDLLERNSKRLDPVPEKVLARTYVNMEPPDPQEGWDSILLG
jgi:predicted kinase